MILSRIFQILGWVCAAWFGLVGGGFSAIYLIGFLGTAGKEGGGEFVVVFIGTVVGVVVGLLMVKLGKRLAMPKSIDM